MELRSRSRSTAIELRVAELFHLAPTALSLACRYLILARDKPFGVLLAAGPPPLSLPRFLFLPSFLSFFRSTARQTGRRESKDPTAAPVPVSACPITICQLKVEAVYISIYIYTQGPIKRDLPGSWKEGGKRLVYREKVRLPGISERSKGGEPGHRREDEWANFYYLYGANES